MAWIGVRTAGQSAGGVLVLLGAFLTATASAPAAAQEEPPQAGGHLAAFRGERDLRKFLARLEQSRKPKVLANMAAPAFEAPPPPPPPPAPMMESAAPVATVSADNIVVTGART